HRRSPRSADQNLRTGAQAKGHVGAYANVMSGDGAAANGGPGSRKHPPGQQAAGGASNVDAKTRDRGRVVCRSLAGVVDETAIHAPAGAGQSSDTRRDRALEQTHFDAGLRTRSRTAEHKSERGVSSDGDDDSKHGSLFKFDPMTGSAGLL